MQQIRDWYNIVKNLMGKLVGSKNRMVILKTVLLLGFFTALIGTVIFVEGMETPAEDAEVMAARRAKETEMDLSTLAVQEEISRPHEAEIHKEIVNGMILGDVPAADYAYSFDREVRGARIVTRPEENGEYCDGAYPVENTEKTPLFTEGIEGEAVYLDGSYGIELCDMKPLAESYTISFWMRAEEIYDWSPFLVIGSNLLDADVSQNYISFNKKTSEDSQDVVPIFNTINAYCGNSCEVRPSLEEKDCIDLHEWNYITIRVDGSKISEEDSSKVTAYLYINSEMVGSSEVSKMSFEETNMHAYLGINCFDRLFKVCYDELRIWNTLLSESQINDMYIAYIQSGNR